MNDNKQASYISSLHFINDQSISEWSVLSCWSGPDVLVLLGVVQHCSLLLASPGSDGDM